MSLLPKDVKFFDQFFHQARLVVEASDVLRQAAEQGSDHFAEAAGRIAEIEGRGDDLEHEVHRRLHKTFITPVDPEDIHAIATSLDEVLDGIEAIAYRLAAYRIERIPDRVKALAANLHECAKALVLAFEALNDKGLEKKEYVTEQCIQVNRIESEGEKIARGGVAEIFANEHDPILLIKEKEIYEYFELTGDRCENVASTLENVMAKNS